MNIAEKIKNPPLAYVQPIPSADSAADEFRKINEVLETI